MQLECFRVVTPPSVGAEWDIRADDAMVVDWDNQPQVGKLGAIRRQDGGIEIVLLKAGEVCAGIGRIVRPAELILAKI